ncbi:MAG: EmrB/QacA subfamily drug resistance transporter [Verrucomicrobiales bacterium]|jgi:EmrB/QacA subfamily drug resistance transporter
MNRNWTIAAAAIAAGMAFIDTTALTVALPDLRNAFSADDSALLWIHNAYAIPLAALLLIGGSLGDRYGTRRLFLIGIALFGIASVACGFAPDTATLIIMRTAQGLGAAIMIPGSLAMIARATPGHSLGRAIGLWSMFTIIATALGPVVGGLVVQYGLWRGVFFINAPLAALAFFITLTRTSADPPRAERSHRLDWIGAFLLAAALASLSWALIDRPLIAVAAIVFVALFYFRERSTSHPLLAPTLFTSRHLTSATSISLLVYSAWGGFTYLLPTFLIDSLGFAPAIAGLLQLPSIVLIACISPFAGKFLDQRGPRWPLAIGALISAIGFSTLLWPGFTEHPLGILVPLAFLGIGLGFCAAPLSATIMQSVPTDQHGLASGLNSTAARIASAIGVALLGGLAYRHGTLDLSALAITATVLCLCAVPFALTFSKPTEPT